MAIIDVALERVPPDFKVTLPVILRTKSGAAASAKIHVTGKTHVEAPLPELPESIEFNPLHSILCDLEVRKL
jgi:hypothetical protein